MKKIVLKTDQRHPQIQTYRQAVERGKENQHVLPRGSSWIVKRAGSPKATRIFDTQGEAINRAKDIAKRKGTTLLVHGSNGRIRERRDY